MGIGDNIYYNRSRVGLSQEELAEQLNVPVQSVLDWEERIAKPEMDLILQMCGVFSCSLDSLLIGETEIEKASDELIKEYERTMKAVILGGTWIAGLAFFTVASYFILMSFGRSSTFSSIITSLIFTAMCYVIAITSHRHKAFVKKYPQLPNLFTKEQMDKSDTHSAALFFVALVIVGLGVFVLVRRSALPVLSEMGILFSVGVFIIILGFAFMLLTNACMRINMYNTEHYNKENLKKETDSA